MAIANDTCTKRGLVVAAVCLSLFGLVSFPATAQQPPPAPPVTVSQPVKKVVVDWEEFTGQFAAVEYVELRARVSGYLEEIRFTDGQMVSKGDVLFGIDPRPYDIALASAKARLEQARAQLELANRQLSRAGELRQKDFVAQSTYDQRIQDTRVAAASVEVARAAVRDAELNLEFTHVTAPVDGRIGAHMVGIGNVISGGANIPSPTLLATIVSLDPIYFVFDMSETDFLAHQRAARSRQTSGRDDIPVAVQLTDETEWTRTGRLNFIDNQVDRGAGTIRSRAILANPDRFITPGAFGRIRLPASEPYEALLVPDEAIVTDQSRKIVMTVTADGSVVPKPVQLGALFEGLRVVRSGLAPEDNVIINGLMRARPGAKVTPQPGTIPGAAAAPAAPAAPAPPGDAAAKPAGK